MLGMAARKPHALVYTNTFKEHVKLVERKHHRLIRETLENQLQYDPEIATRNRKPLKKPMAFEAEWELRFGPANRFRVFYRVDGNDVVLLAFGEKTRDRLTIGGQEVEDEKSNAGKGPGTPS
jgi:hypothetical protein